VSSKYEEMLKAKPQLQFCHCQTQMSWNPSTKRKQHLLAICAKFRLSDAGNDIRIMSEREEFIDKKAKKAKVRLPFKNPLPCPSPMHTLLCNGRSYIPELDSSCKQLLKFVLMQASAIEAFNV
jgi:hypothetical protein